MDDTIGYAQFSKIFYQPLLRILNSSVHFICSALLCLPPPLLLALLLFWFWYTFKVSIAFYLGLIYSICYYRHFFFIRLILVEFLFKCGFNANPYLDIILRNKRECPSTISRTCSFSYFVDLGFAILWKIAIHDSIISCNI